MRSATEIKRSSRRAGLLYLAAAYVVSCVVAIVFPARIEAFNQFAFPLYFGEFIVILGLAFIGAKPRAAEA